MIDQGSKKRTTVVLLLLFIVQAVCFKHLGSAGFSAQYSKHEGRAFCGRESGPRFQHSTFPLPSLSHEDADGGAEKGEEFQMLLKEEEFQVILQALRAFQAEHKHLRIPKLFKVPESPPWPETAYGLSLGNRVYNMKFWQEFVVGFPERRDQLDELGFLWARLQSDYNLVLEALINYKLLHNHLLVPAKFVVPCTPEWPEHLWDLALGVRVSQIRQRNDYIRSDSQRWLQLTEMGFIWDHEDKVFSTVILALRTYREIYGHMRVPTRFIVPSSNAWPKETHKLALGDTVRKIKRDNRYLISKPQRVEELEKIGFVWTSNNDMKFQILVKALEKYKALHGNLDKIPQKFTVPKCKPWPEECWGLSLGNKVWAIQAKQLYIKNKPDRAKRLKIIGLDLDPTNQPTSICTRKGT